MLVADFERAFPAGPSIHGQLREPIEPPGVTAILGTSGSGKTTILRCLAGLDRPDKGSIAFGDETWFDSSRGLHIAPEARGIGLMFQEYALFPHLTVAGNIAFGLRRTPGSPARVSELIERFQLSGLERRYPSQLSGGQQQRVALARTIALRPTLLLLDEPLSALDAPTRDEIRQPLRELFSDLHTPVVLVTHDRLDALALAQRVLIVEGGNVVQAGSVASVFAAPASASVARLVGVETVARGRVAGHEGGVCDIQVGRATVRAAVHPPAAGEVDICIRAEDVTLFAAEPASASAQNRWQGRVLAISDLGGTWRIALDCGFTLTALVTRAAGQALGLREGGVVWAAVKATAITVLRS